MEHHWPFQPADSHPQVSLESIQTMLTAGSPSLCHLVQFWFWTLRLSRPSVGKLITDVAMFLTYYVHPMTPCDAFIKWLVSQLLPRKQFLSSPVRACVWLKFWKDKKSPLENLLGKSKTRSWKPIPGKLTWLYFDFISFVCTFVFWNSDMAVTMSCGCIL